MSRHISADHNASPPTVGTSGAEGSRVDLLAGEIGGARKVRDLRRTDKTGCKDKLPGPQRHGLAITHDVHDPFVPGLIEDGATALCPAPYVELHDRCVGIK